MTRTRMPEVARTARRGPTSIVAATLLGWLAAAWPAAPAAAHGPLDLQIAEVDRELAAVPRSVGALRRRAELLRLDGAWAAALADLDAIDRLAPGNALTRWLRGRVLLDRGNAAEARDELLVYLELAPVEPGSLALRARAHLLLARAERRLGRPLAAASRYREAIAEGGALDPQVFLDCAEAWESAGRWWQALDCLREGIARLGPVAALERRAGELARHAPARGALTGSGDRPPILPVHFSTPGGRPRPVPAAPGREARAATSSAAPAMLIPAGSEWRFLDDGSGPPFAWVDPGHADAGWSLGTAPLGYGDPGLWPVGFGPDPANKFITTYFRHRVTVADPAAYQRLTVRLRRDDGAIVYLNGAEVVRTHLPAGPVGPSTPASTTVAGADETAFHEFPVDPRLLLAGENTVAVEIHQWGPASSDLAFDLELSGTVYPPGAPRLTRGPYLQQPTPGSVRVRWRTDLPTDSRVRWGPEPAQLVDARVEATATTEHDVLVTGLEEDTTYFYDVGSTAGTLAGGDAITAFTTPPAAGAARPTRLWVIGDSGSCGPPEFAAWCPRARAVRNAFLSYSGGQPTDAWLLLGDNAYHVGTQQEYQRALFDLYPGLLRRASVWPTLGNHEGLASDSATQSGPYFEVFSLPAAGEAGGAASGTEAYYSFDLANIHFVVLDSFGSARTPPSAMLEWLEADLAGAAADWLIAFWHHPPYSKGSHDSDAPSPPADLELAEMREHALPILEAYGVDLVLAGHSHIYERSLLVDGHHLDSTTLTEAHRRASGSGHPARPYVKPSFLPGRAPNEGAVYTVAGSSGLLGYRLGLHPVMRVTLERMGSLVIDVDGNVLDAAFVDEHRVVRDRFSLVKGCRGGPHTGDSDDDGVCDDLDCRPGDPRVGLDRLALTGATIGGLIELAEEFTACTSIRAGEDLVVGGGGDVTLSAGGEIAVTNGLAVATGAALTCAIDPGLVPP